MKVHLDSGKIRIQAQNIKCHFFQRKIFRNIFCAKALIINLLGKFSLVYQNNNNHYSYIRRNETKNKVMPKVHLPPVKPLMNNAKI